MHERSAECRGTRRGIGEAQVVPELGSQTPRGWPGTEQRPADGWTPLALICWEGSPSRREVDGGADDRALAACGLELPQGKTSIADQGFVGRQWLVGPLE